MIGLLRGRVLARQPPSLLLEVNGVGYEVEAPMSTFYDLPEADQEVVLYTHMMVRDDAHSLFGFIRESDRALFRSLLKVNGVGGKMALAILSGMTVDEFSLYVQSGDVKALCRLPGVGKKTAERLIIEMRDRLEKIETGMVAGVPAAGSAASAPASADGDAVSALLALGYKGPEATRMVAAVFSEDMDTETVIRLALQGKAQG
ncbi:Holliday junction branch migration protein RuvA [Thiolapillus brandeum]|uniref:Holliday junction branch migration complex subunit RuvA n=1 Tax=Thiolapillus brandeum TaxID=1076588 RepID=A0A7U6JIC2_9GAMM|nr:Holliday junction branch migration protein RuvA [Thiolapillus brandeum]BAO45156.1 Holliday junction DNA helicase RuvA [Thiolapillus brandeum]